MAQSPTISSDRSPKRFRQVEIEHRRRECKKRRSQKGRSQMRLDLSNRTLDGFEDALTLDWYESACKLKSFHRTDKSVGTNVLVECSFLQGQTWENSRERPR